MDVSPIERLLLAVDERDVDAIVALLSPDVQFLAVDGRRADGRDEARGLISDALSVVRRVSHEIISQWHHDEVWIAEVSLTYELQDWYLLRDAPRALFVHQGPEGITEWHIYGAHERPLAEHGGDSGELRIGGTPMLPL
jgi:SnoaL-like protein